MKAEEKNGLKNKVGRSFHSFGLCIALFSGCVNHSSGKTRQIRASLETRMNAHMGKPIEMAKIYRILKELPEWTVYADYLKKLTKYSYRGTQGKEL